MKPCKSLHNLLAAVGGSVFVISSASAADLFWSGDAASQGGTGTWDTTNVNWGTIAAGPYSSVWNNTNNDTAVFGGATGTVTLGTNVAVGGLQFDTLDYVIAPTASETITLAAGSNLGSSVVGGNGTPNRSPMITAAFAGSDGFTKTGTGRIYLNFNGSSTLTGDINIAAGQLYSRFEALGSGNIVFTGNSDFTKVYGATNGTTKSFTINDGVTASIGGSTFYYNFTTTGVLAGGNTARFVMNMGGNTEKNFNNTANTFTGELTVTGGGVGSSTNNNGGRARFRSLPDSDEKLVINNSTFILNNGGVSMDFANRQLEMLGGGNARIMNESTDSAVTMAFAQDVLVSLGNNSRTLILAGANTGDNTIAGSISNSANGTGVLSLAKWNAGTWVLGGANTYTGATTISAGTLTLGVDDCLADASTMVIGGGTLNLADSVNDTVGTLRVTNAAAKINLGSGATLAFADSSAADWTGGTLDITGTFVEASSLRFGDGSSAGLTSTQLGVITLNGTPTSFSLDSNGYLVTGAAPTGFAAWQTANSTAGGLDDDHDGDGVDNGVEFFLGGTADTSGFTPLPGVDSTGGMLSVTWTKAATYAGAYGTDFVVETSASLDAGSWTTEIVAPNPGATVTITGDDVTYTFPAGTKNFARLKVLGPN